MASYFRESRNVELSTLYYLETNLTADWSGTSVIKTFKQAYSKDINLPIVCIRLADIGSTRREVGSTTLNNGYLIIIDIFARSDGQRLDLSDYILDKIKDSWVFYLHSHTSGDNTTLVRTANGRCSVEQFISNTKVEPFENTDEKDFYRHSISVRVKVN